ncbi:putative LPLAT superfamily acyltransferase [Natronospira proteinivora]|uniref:LPLAT superfamily acyltransferase n=1 Tax=Natronospira proteinivora TaxID=1807133 RepID=A0ABT1G8T1_9GAMM|nr:glycosyltransferase family 2 protein [Natronospira proteinivora]MCP1727724.1 putative LPLAT superfamily acyltransferase [Natronospira proteinivora]
MNLSFCAVVPVYRQPERVAEVVAQLRDQGLPCYLVDDGNDADTARRLAEIAQADPHVILLRQAINRGKGIAVLCGMRQARADGFSHVLQVDADGQHDLADLPAFLDAARAEPQALISGRPRYDASVPAGRVFARYITHVWVWIETLSFQIRDSMCGYRIYPLAASLAVADEEGVGPRMDFDTEIMVRLFWRGTAVRFIETGVRYDTGSRSTFRLFRDNVRISAMHVRLVFGMLARWPGWLMAGRRADHWAGVEEPGTVLGMRMAVWAYRLLGRRGMAVVLFPAALYFLLFNGRARRASMHYFRRLHAFDPSQPRPGWRTTFRHFWQFVRANIKRVEAWSGGGDPDALEMPNWEAFQSLLDRGQGALLVGAHAGNLEVGRALATRYPEVKINALIYTANARKYNRVMRALNREHGARVIMVEEIGADTALMLKSRIDQGEFVVIVGDRAPVAVDSPRVRLPFLGDETDFPIGPWVLAHALQCPVYGFFYMDRPDGNARIYFERFAERLRLPRREREAKLRSVVDEYVRRLESLLCEYPYQWYNFYDFWQDETPARRAGVVEPESPVEKE